MICTAVAPDAVLTICTYADTGPPSLAFGYGSGLAGVRRGVLGIR